MYYCNLTYNLEKNKKNCHHVKLNLGFSQTTKLKLSYIIYTFFQIWIRTFYNVGSRSVLLQTIDGKSWLNKLYTSCEAGQVQTKYDYNSIIPAVLHYSYNFQRGEALCLLKNVNLSLTFFGSRHCTCAYTVECGLRRRGEIIAVDLSLLV